MNAAETPAPRVVPVWKSVDEALRAELVAMWGRHGAIAEPALAAVRAGQAVCVARDADGALCGVATAAVRVLPRLGQPMYYYRQYFAPSLRGRRHATSFLNAARGILQAYNASLPAPESLGVLIELENAALAAAYDRVVIPEVGMTFVGYSARGLRLLAGWFDEARLLPPRVSRAPARRPAPPRGPG